MVPKFFKDADHYRQWQLHCIHTDGMSHAIGEEPSRADEITDPEFRQHYEQGYRDGQGYLAEEAAEYAE
jgi:hypothetical protein